MATRHRKDMQHMDFYVLSRFVHAIRQVCINSRCPALELGTITMLLPTWYLSGAGWGLAGYREYTEPAFGIPRNHMQTMCDYLGIEMRVVLDVLFRFSMLAVVPGTLATDLKPRFRMGYSG